MQVGLFTEFHCPPGMEETRAFDESMAEMRAAEELGFDVAWLAELHFQKHRSVLSSPLVIAAAIAAVTRRIRIGIAVQVLSLGHPLRIAEDAATVDHLSHGRLEFGVGRSGLPAHYRGFNIPTAEGRDRFLEAFEIILKAWRQERFSHHGRFFRFDDVSIVPRPCQTPHPPIRIAATSEDTYAMVGRMGYPLFATPRTTSIHEVKDAIALYRREWKDARHGGDPDVAMIVPVYVADTAARVREHAEASTMHFFRSIGLALQEGAGANDAMADVRRRRGRLLASLSWDDVLRDWVIYGTPDEVAERLLAFREETGFARLAAWMNTGNLVGHERVLGSMRLFIERVAPRLA